MVICKRYSKIIRRLYEDYSLIVQMRSNNHGISF